MTAALVVAGVAAVVDWTAVFLDRSRVELIAKPVVMLSLAVGVATRTDDAAGWLVVAALLLALLGDVFLTTVVDDFIAGLTAFLAAHIAYGAALITSGVDPPMLLIGSVIALAGIVAVGRPVVRGATSVDETLGRAVVAYVLVLSTMLALAVSTAAPLAIAGAALFTASDGVLGWNRFVRPLPRGRLSTHIPYHIGQGLLAAWAVWG